MIEQFLSPSALATLRPENFRDVPKDSTSFFVSLVAMTSPSLSRRIVSTASPNFHAPSFMTSCPSLGTWSSPESELHTDTTPPAGHFTVRWNLYTTSSPRIWSWSRYGFTLV